MDVRCSCDISFTATGQMDRQTETTEPQATAVVSAEALTKKLLTLRNVSLSCSCVSCFSKVAVGGVCTVRSSPSCALLLYLTDRNGWTSSHFKLQSFIVFTLVFHRQRPCPVLDRHCSMKLWRCLHIHAAHSHGPFCVTFSPEHKGKWWVYLEIFDSIWIVDIIRL